MIPEYILQIKKKNIPAMSQYQKKYGTCGRQLAPEDPEDPMYSDLYCQKYITDCDRVITITFDNSLKENSFKIKTVSIRIDAAYNTLQSIHSVLKENYREYPDIENLEYFYTKKNHPSIELTGREWLDKYSYFDILVCRKQ